MGYGYGFWRGYQDSYRASGMLGQTCIILEDKNAVIVVNANERNSQAIRDCIRDYIFLFYNINAKKVELIFSYYCSIFFLLSPLKGLR